MSRFDVESVDLLLLARFLAATFGERLEGDVVGRTRLRDATAGELGCSLLDAEHIVDTMVARGFVVREATSGRAELRVVTSDP